MDRITELREKLTELKSAAETILSDAESAGKQPTPEQLDAADERMDQYDEARKELRALERLQQINAEPAGRRSAPENPTDRSVTLPDGDITGGEHRNDDKGKRGFATFGHMAAAIATASQRGGYVDARLEKRAPTTFGSEGTGADGGFPIAPDFATEIMRQVTGEESLLGMTDQQTSSSNTWTAPSDETTPWQSTGGIQGSWIGEATQMTQSKPSLKRVNVNLEKYAVLVPMTEELLEDAPSMNRYLSTKVPENINFAITLSIIQGTGVGEPLGILNSPATVAVSKTGSQVADTLVAQNIIDMWARMHAVRRRTSVWLVNQDIEPMLDTLSKAGKDDTGAAATGWGTPLFVPSGGLSATPFDTLKGRPIIPTEACNTLGDKGDIILASLGQYLTVSKTGGIRSEVSIHLWFDYDVQAFRFIIRIGGRPWLSAPIARCSGSNTLSPFVTLAARA